MNRRMILKGLGATIALPSLSAFSKSNSKVDPKLIFMGFPFGITDTKWFPKESGNDYKMTEPLSALKEHRKDFTIFRNFNHRNTHNAHDGCSTFLTDANIYGTPGKVYQNAISCDQVAAQTLGTNTRYSSISLSSPGQSGTPDSGWGRGLSLSWNSLGSTIPSITRPLDLYYALFGGTVTKEERIFQLQKKKSVLDSYVMSFKRIQKSVTKEDREKLEEYANSIRTIEGQLSKEKEWINTPYPKASMKKPAPGVPVGSTEEHRLFYDLMAVALHTGATNVITYRLAYYGILEKMGYKSGHHSLNHQRGDLNLKIGTAKDKQMLANYGYFITKLKKLKEVDGTSIFDNCAVSIGSSCRHGHSTRDLPLVVAGKLQGKIKQGQQISYLNNKPGAISEVWLTLLQAAGCPVEKFSTATSAVSEMAV